MRLLTAGRPQAQGKTATAKRLPYFRSTLLALLLIIYLPFQSLAQNNITVQGRVTEEGGNGLAGVTVSVKGTSNSVVSNDGGQFSISAPSNGTLTFTSVGFEPRDIAINNQTAINISLTTLSTSLDQVVVVGYGTQRRATVTGAIANVSGKTISELPVASISQALQGRVAGVQVTNNGSPGTQPIVRIRGISSISFASFFTTSS